METGHHLGEWIFGICNHCGVMTAWSRLTWNFFEQFLCVFGKIFKILFRKFTWRYRLTLLCSNVVKYVRREIGEIVRYLSQKKFRLPLKLSLLRGSPPKSARASPPNIWLTWFQISSKSVLFGGVMAERANAVLLPREYFHNSPEAKHRFRRIINELALMYDVTRTHDS